MASNPLIDAYLDDLYSRLPRDTVDELADGLHETWQHHRDQGLTPTAAAHAAIAEFGSPTQITDAFIVHASGRHTARLLLTTSPIIGVCWGAGLVAAHATWPVPDAAAAAMAASLIGVVACLVLAATSRHDYGRTRLGHLGADPNPRDATQR
jgi:hypothetical protein